MKDSERPKGLLFGLLMCALGMILSLTIMLHPSWTQAPHWIVYLSSFLMNVMGLICITASQNWRTWRNILIFIMTVILGGVFGWYAIGLGPRECFAGHTLESGLTCRIPSGVGSLLWLFCAWGTLFGKIQD